MCASGALVVLGKGLTMWLPWRRRSAQPGSSAPDSDGARNRTALYQLDQSISDVGYWRTWAAQLPESVQFDFGAVQLAIDSGPGIPRPVHSVTLRFSRPSHVVFIARDGSLIAALVGGRDLDPAGQAEFERQAPDTESTLEEDWPRQLRTGAVGPQAVTNDSFSFLDRGVAGRIISESKSGLALVGTGGSLDTWANAPARLIFWAGQVGAFVAAEEMQLFGDERPIAIDDVESMRRAWFVYWKQYWTRRRTADALPVDYACEVTHPGTGVLK